MFPFWYLVARFWAWLLGREATPYHFFAHRVLHVDDLSPIQWNRKRWRFERYGKLPRYSREYGTVSYIIPKRGSVPEAISESEEVLIPVHDLASNPTVRLNELRGGNRKEPLYRAIRRGEESLDRQSDIQVAILLERASQGDHRIKVPNAYFLPIHLLEAFSKIREHEYPVVNILISPTGLSLMKMWSTNLITWNGAKESNKQGIFGYFDGAAIRVSTMIPKDKVYVLSDPRRVGVVPIRAKRQIATSNEAKRLRLGWVIWDEKGFGIVNGHAVASVHLVEPAKAQSEPMEIVDFDELDAQEIDLT